MVYLTRRYKHTIIKLCLTLSLIAFSAGILGGCATTSKNGRLQVNNSVTELFETQQFLPNHSYYYYGFQAIPYAIVGIDNQYKLISSIWSPVIPDPDLLKQLITRMQIVYSGIPQGAWIIGPNDERIGIWYSTEKRTAIRLRDDSSILISAPAPPNMRGIP